MKKSAKIFLGIIGGICAVLRLCECRGFRVGNGCAAGSYDGRVARLFAGRRARVRGDGAAYRAGKAGARGGRVGVCLQAAVLFFRAGG